MGETLHHIEGILTLRKWKAPPARTGRAVTYAVYATVGLILITGGFIRDVESANGKLFFRLLRLGIPADLLIEDTHPVVP